MSNGQILSIGYGSQSQVQLLNQLSAHNVDYLIDVRSSPYSRFQPDFSRDPLSEALKSISIRYVFMGDMLGGRPKDEDCYTHGHVDYTKVRSKDFFVQGIDRLRTAHAQGHRVCLMCSEGQPSQCHRSKLIGEALKDLGIEIVHLLPNGGTKGQTDVIAELTEGQGDMFGESFMSRSTYR